mmetsp:Transcript_43552/g.100296  ORF Transcript_43552/g.100296 Transcript_43552/m.100296 type:complete len:272 (-) Transcript_43552:1590-2405(-)
MEQLTHLMSSGSALAVATIVWVPCRTTRASVGSFKSRSTTRTFLSTVAATFVAKIVAVATSVRSSVIQDPVHHVRHEVRLAIAIAVWSSEPSRVVVNLPHGLAERYVARNLHAVCTHARSGATADRAHRAQAPQNSIATVELRSRIDCAALKILVVRIDATSCWTAASTGVNGCAILVLVAHVNVIRSTKVISVPVARRETAMDLRRQVSSSVVSTGGHFVQTHCHCALRFVENHMPCVATLANELVTRMSADRVMRRFRNNVAVARRDGR